MHDPPLIDQTRAATLELGRLLDDEVRKIANGNFSIDKDVATRQGVAILRLVVDSSYQDA